MDTTFSFHRRFFTPCCRKDRVLLITLKMVLNIVEMMFHQNAQADITLFVVDFANIIKKQNNPKILGP